ncbi:MAG: hypothetical protein ACSLFE_06335 [Gemmatimonadaceae bacterium]
MQRKFGKPFVPAATVALLLLVIAGCSEPVGPDTTAPAASIHAKGGNSGGGSGSGSGAYVIQGDLVLTDANAPALTSTCPTPHGFSGSGWALVYGKTGCLLAPTVWTSTDPTLAEYKVADDVVLGVQMEKGKNGRITHVRLNGQDVDGEAGIWHTTYWIPVAQPVVPTTAGFTLRVHARDIPVWRTDSHLARGSNPVQVIGLISIGDIVYPAQ